MRLQWTDNAHKDLFQIADFLDGETAGSSSRMLSNALVAANMLIDHPQIGPAIAGSQIRKWPVPDSPLRLLYLVGEDHLSIIRVVHNRSDWQSLA